MALGPYSDPITFELLADTVLYIGPFSDPTTFTLVLDADAFIFPFSDPETIGTAGSSVWSISTGTVWIEAEMTLPQLP